MNKQQIQLLFQQVFNNEADLCVQSPGRINIIGEHTDYNNGFVLPAAIDKKVIVGIRKREDDLIVLYAEAFAEKKEVKIPEMKPQGDWADYMLGVVAQLIKKNYVIGGFEILLKGDIPIGAGLSSSAAVECATIFALNELFHFGLEKMEMVQMAQMAEHEYAGVKCGIMDQFASMFGKKDHLIKLDCRSLEYEYIPFQNQDFVLVLFNSNVKHALVDSEYNIRRNQCNEGVEMIRKYHPQINSLRDADTEMVEKYIRPQDELIYRRCHYVVSENIRLLQLCEALNHNNLDNCGKLMHETHLGLSEDYEVSCPELDLLVKIAMEQPGVIGARLVGGGFGGCTINLVRKENLESVIYEVENGYKLSSGKEATTYIVNVEDGTKLI
ncbi:MAG: galactokinase [Saprospiraceae bacterium]|jgi:galactokinase|nr:galactokinase [Candidatus Brachybacter algidus]